LKGGAVTSATSSDRPIATYTNIKACLIPQYVMCAASFDEIAMGWHQGMSSAVPNSACVTGTRPDGEEKVSMMHATSALLLNL